LTSAGVLWGDDFDFDATVRLQASDGLLALRALALVSLGHGLLLALAFGVDAVGFHALADQVFLDGGSALLGQLLVVGIGAEAVGVADGDDHFELDALDLLDQLVELGLAFGTQGGLVEVEQGVGGEGDLLGSRLHAGGGGLASGLGDGGLAFFLRQQILVAGAAGRVVGGGGRGPETGTPAEAGTALDDFVAGVDRIDAVGGGLGLGQRGAETEGGGQNGHQGVFRNFVHICFLFS